MISSKMLRHEFTRKIVQGTRFELQFNGKKYRFSPVSNFLQNYTKDILKFLTLYLKIHQTTRSLEEEIENKCQI